MQGFLAKKILLGVTGGVAAYKAAELARLLQQAGAEVQVIMTASALNFVGAQTFQALTGKPVWVETNDSDFERSMAHIDLSRWADLLLIAPATANIMAKMAHGLADDLLSLVTMMMCHKPILLCPAMNVNMWSHPATQANQQILRERGIIFVGPDAGLQACGDQGWGRMREPVWILNAIELVDCHQRLQGQRFLLTAGPTREALDPVRYLSNHSTGVMGYALAEALSFAGADVHLVSGPCALSIPPGIHHTRVESAQEMYEAVFANLVEDLSFIGVAAVADFRPKQAKPQKIKKQKQQDWLLELEPCQDILAAVKAWGKAKKVIGFAAETENVLAHAQAKLETKADMIIANIVGHDQGFGFKDSALTVLTPNQMKSLSSNSKLRLAAQLVDCIEDLIQN